MAEKAEYSPMMQKYLETKEKYKDCILFYRLGDFYEMFFEDAITASRELEITLTGKVCGTEERAPMAGVPHHAAENLPGRAHHVSGPHDAPQPGADRKPARRRKARVAAVAAG